MNIKHALAITMLAFTSFAFADSVSVMVGQQSAISNGADSNAYNLTYTKTLTKALDGDISILNTVADSTNKVSARYELGLTGKYQINDIVSGYLRGAVGERVSGSTNTEFAYYAIEPGVIATFGDFSGKIGYRYRNAFDTANLDKTNSVRYAVGYNLTKVDKLNLGYDHVVGDSGFNRTYVSYTRSF